MDLTKERYLELASQHEKSAERYRKQVLKHERAVKLYTRLAKGAKDAKQKCSQ